MGGRQSPIRTLYLRNGPMSTHAPKAHLRSRSPCSFLVGEGGAGAHDLVRMMREGEHAIWAASASQWYAEPKRLAGLGLLHAERTPGAHARAHALHADRRRAGRRCASGWPSPARSRASNASRSCACSRPSTSTPRCSSARWRRCGSRSRSPTRRSPAPRRSRQASYPHRERVLLINHRLRAAHPRRARGVAGRGRGRAQGCSSPA